MKNSSSGKDASASLRDAQKWSSVVVKHSMRLEHAAVDIGTDRVNYHLDVDLSEPLPNALLAHAEFLCLSWPFGGIWKIRMLSNNNRTVHCQSWRTTEMDHNQVNELAKKIEEQEAREQLGEVEALAATDSDKDSDPLPPCLFQWKMLLGTWGDNTAHWFLHDIRPPASTEQVRPGEQEVLMTDDELKNMPIVVQLLAGFTPLEVQVEVNAITAVETVEQTIAADITWQVTLPALSTICEDSVITELLDIFDFDAEEFELTNLNSAEDDRELETALTIAGQVEFFDPTLTLTRGESKQKFVDWAHHLQFSRRIIGDFGQEMSLYNFPFDQQKLTFDFSTGSGMSPSMRITPASVDAGSFAIENYKLGNVFDAVYQDKVFVGPVDDTGPKKTMSFGIMLERKSGYYLTNVAIPSACITYLCFISYAPLSDGTLMDTDARLQIVLTLLLTAVTFKNQVASLIPQVSYFTLLDKYVFFCFVVACLVALENSLFPLFQDWFYERWTEANLLGFAFGVFTIINLTWALHTLVFVTKRKISEKVFRRVHELARVVSAEIPSSHREAVLRKYIAGSHTPNWALPALEVSHKGDVFVQLPEGSPLDAKEKAKRALEQTESRHAAEEKRDELRGIYEKLEPSVTLPKRSWSVRTIPVARPPAMSTGEGRHGHRRHSVSTDSATSPVRIMSPAQRRFEAASPAGRRQNRRHPFV